MRKMIFIGMLAVLSVLFTACGAPATPAGGTLGKPVNLAVTTNPSPAAMGVIELILTITDAGGQPVEGATVDLAVDHTDMTGMSMSGVATDQGGGKYSIKANFEMSGNWTLTVYVRKDGLDYREDIAFPVQ
jgi:hypothetical protein